MNNLFPSAVADAPDLVEEETRRSVVGGFPSAPALSAFTKSSVAAELREVGDEMDAGGTKIERAIAFLRQHGPATYEELAAHLRVKKDALSAYIQTAIKDGRIVREGGQMRIGDGAPTPRQHAEPKATPALAAKPAAAGPRAPKATATDAKVHASLCVGDLQIIAWTAGNLTVRANDNVVDLSEAQVIALHAFLELAR